MCRTEKTYSREQGGVAMDECCKPKHAGECENAPETSMERSLIPGLTPSMTVRKVKVQKPDVHEAPTQPVEKIEPEEKP